MRTASIRLTGHPDHACDCVAEAIVDEYARRDPESRLRLSVNGGRGALFISGDVLSQADFDVSALVKRTLGSLGITDDIESFVSLEPVVSERVAAMRLLPESAVTVTGYATNETESLVPETVELAKRVGKTLQEKRDGDTDWYWLGPDSEVTVFADKISPSRVVIMIEHGNESLEKVRTLIKDELKFISSNVRIDVNPTGARERRGIAQMIGMSGKNFSSYGSLIPSMHSVIGHDLLSAEKAGAWLARHAARKIVQNGSRAALVQAVYLPGEKSPVIITARDEQGKDQSALLKKEDLHLDRAMKDWWRNGLNLDAARWGFAGESGLPWEEHKENF